MVQLIIKILLWYADQPVSRLIRKFQKYSLSELMPENKAEWKEHFMILDPLLVDDITSTFLP
jgi:hypothetical protein